MSSKLHFLDWVEHRNEFMETLTLELTYYGFTFTEIDRTITELSRELESAGKTGRRNKRFIAKLEADLKEYRETVETLRQRISAWQDKFSIPIREEMLVPQAARELAHRNFKEMQQKESGTENFVDYVPHYFWVGEVFFDLGDFLTETTGMPRERIAETVANLQGRLFLETIAALEKQGCRLATFTAQPGQSITLSEEEFSVLVISSIGGIRILGTPISLRSLDDIIFHCTDHRFQYDPVYYFDLKDRKSQPFLELKVHPCFFLIPDHPEQTAHSLAEIAQHIVFSNADDVIIYFNHQNEPRIKSILSFPNQQIKIGSPLKVRTGMSNFPFFLKDPGKHDYGLELNNFPRWPDYLNPDHLVPVTVAVLKLPRNKEFFS